MLGIGPIIWISLRPLIRLALNVAFGFAITKIDVFPVVASRAAGQIILRITLPCLMFSVIIPAFSTSNISALGPLFLVAFIYEGLGMLLAWLVSQFFWVPHRFRHGIIQAGGWGNWADLPTAVVMSLAAGPPFNPAVDKTLAVAYVSAFIFVFFVTLFPCGGNRLVALDFVGPEVEDEERQEMVRLKRQAVFNACKHLPSFLGSCVPGLRHRRNIAQPQEDDEKWHSSGEDLHTPDEKVPRTPCDEEAGTPQSSSHAPSASVTRNVSFAADLDATTAVPSEPDRDHCIADPDATTVLSRAASPTHVGEYEQQPPPHSHSSSTAAHDKAVRFRSPSPTSPPPPPPHQAHRWGRLIWRGTCSFFISLLSPASVSIISAFVIALVTPLKELFIPLPGSPIPNAPDGQPPLAFIMDTATFVGAGSVPLGLICLGSALARLKVPMNRESWRTMPTGSIMALAVGKMCVLPVLGVLIVGGLTHVGVVPRDDKVLRFVCIFFSCLPTATTQVYLSQVYSATGSADHISAFLIPQYILMIPAMTILTAYSLDMLF